MSIENGQAEASNDLNDLADLLVGDAENAADDDEDQNEEELQDEASDEPEGEEESSEEESANNQTSGKLFEVKIKGENGEDVTEKVTEKDLVAGYMRTKDYTQKTMRLADTEKQVIHVAQSRIEEGRQYFQTQARIAREAVLQLAGTKSEADMYRLSIDDPAGWVQEQHRAKVINDYLVNIDNAITQESKNSDQEKKQLESVRVQDAWKVLAEKGMTRDKLIAVYDKVGKEYGIPATEFGTIIHPGLALALQDAAKYRDLQSKKPQIANKVRDAERLPSQKKALQNSEKINRNLNPKFKSGKATVNDLSSFLLANKM